MLGFLLSFRLDRKDLIYWSLLLASVFRQRLSLGRITTGGEPVCVLRLFLVLDPSIPFIYPASQPVFLFSSPRMFRPSANMLRLLADTGLYCKGVGALGRTKGIVWRFGHALVMSGTSVVGHGFLMIFQVFCFRFPSFQSFPFRMFFLLMLLSSHFASGMYYLKGQVPESTLFWQQGLQPTGGGGHTICFVGHR